MRGVVANVDKPHREADAARERTHLTTVTQADMASALVRPIDARGGGLKDGGQVLVAQHGQSTHRRGYAPLLRVGQAIDRADDAKGKAALQHMLLEDSKQMTFISVSSRSGEGKWDEAVQGQAPGRHQAKWALAGRPGKA